MLNYEVFDRHASMNYHVETACEVGTRRVTNTHKVKKIYKCAYGQFYFEFTGQICLIASQITDALISVFEDDFVEVTLTFYYF